MKAFRVVVVLALLGLAIVSYLSYELHHVAIKRYTVHIPDLPAEFEGFTILHMTDLHSKWFGLKQQRLLSLIKRQHYDMVAVTGDLVDRHNPENEPALALLKALKKKPIFVVAGNHDWATGFQLCAPLEAMGVRVLVNSSQKFWRDGASIDLLGIDGDPDTENWKLGAILDGLNAKYPGKRAPQILLAHMPTIFPYAVSKKIDLVLAGHTHGGQIRLPFIGAIVAPNQGFFPKYAYGQFQEGSSAMVISGGLGESTVKIRVMNPPEIVYVTLTARSTR